MDGNASASVLQLQRKDSGGTFRIRYWNDSKYYILAQCDGDSVQFTTTGKLKPLDLTLEDSSFADWEKYAAKVKIADDGRYLGYCCKTGLVKIFPSDTVEKPGVVLLDCKAEKMK